MKLFDMHTDTLLKLYKNGSHNLAENDLHVDIRKLRAADSYIQCMALFNRKPDTGYTYDYLADFAAFSTGVLKEHSADLTTVTSLDEVEKNRAQGKLSVLLTIEDMGPVCGNLDHIRELYDLGFRMMSITWNHENSLGYPNSKEPQEMAKGLKEFGIQAVELMNELGIVVDVSHLSDGGFYDVAKHSRKPFVASHSNARAITNVSRNLTDEMIKILADAGGVTGINFYGTFLSDDKISTVDAMLRHIIHIRKVGGIDCLAIGTDFDGIDGELEIDNISKIGLLSSALERAGFTQEEIEKIFYKNALRVSHRAMES